MSAPAGVDRVPYLARASVSWLVLWTFHRRGLPGAVEVLGARGRCGVEADGVWRSWDTIATRGGFTLQEGSAQASKQRIRVRVVIEWAAARLDRADWARLDELIATRSTSIDTADGEDRRLWWKQTYQPGELTEAERAVIAAADRVRRAAEVQMRALVDARLSRDGPVAGEQLGLFP